MKIANKNITASFKIKGAELTSLTKGGQEYIWQANPKHWGRHAPVLFPFVGKLKKDQFKYQGQSFSLGQHGFARDMEFEIVSHDSDVVSFKLDSNPDTLKVYPFRFSLVITYELIGSSLKTSYSVTNNGKDAMWFSIGGHPAFNCPMSKEENRADYWLEFEYAENLEAHLIDGGLISDQKEKIDLLENKLPIRTDLFDKDALVIKDFKSRFITLASSRGRWLTFHLAGFPYLGIWSKNQESPFVCIEPWYGHADNIDHNQELTAKEGIMSLKQKETFGCHYIVELH